MDDFVKGFQQLELPAVTPLDYQGAEEFARQFKNCSALEEHNISYSASTSTDDPALTAAIHNQFAAA